MAFWGRKKANAEGPINEGDPVGYQAVVTLIRTRLDPGPSLEHMTGIGLAPVLAVRYLDLAVVLAGRELLLKLGDRVLLPDTYSPTHDIPTLSSTFSECLLTAELLGVYRAEPAAAGVLGPLSPDVVAINQALQQHPDGQLRLDPPVIGDGSQVGFARRAFGEEAVLKLAERWPDLA